MTRIIEEKQTTFFLLPLSYEGVAHKEVDRKAFFRVRPEYDAVMESPSSHTRDRLAYVHKGASTKQTYW